MKSFAITAVVIALMCTIVSPVLAAETFEITADSTLDGKAGFLFKAWELGVDGSTMFVFEEASKIRVYAIRELGSDAWEIQPGIQYIVPTTSMSINDSWRYLDADAGETVATVVAQESITTNAGTFSCYKVDIELAADLGTVLSSFWFASGFGLIRQDDFFDGTTPVDWRLELQSFFLAGGSGFFPLAVGNVWQYGDIILPVESTTWGAIKAKYN